MMEETRYRLGIMGGTFDPIHAGHLMTAEAVRDALGLSEVLFIPSAHPPHKREENVAPAEHRLRMTELATQSNPYFRVSAMELQREGPSYAVDTVAALQREYRDAELYFITGADAVNELFSWRRAEELLSRCFFVAATRQGTEFDAKSLQEHFGSFGRERIRRVETPALEISSTDIRARIRAGRSIRYLVPSSVEAYIKKEGLYQ